MFRDREQIARINEKEKYWFDSHVRKVIITLNVGKCKTGVKIQSPEFRTFGAYTFPCCQLQGGDGLYSFACLGVLRNAILSSFFNIAYGRHSHEKTKQNHTLVKCAHD